MTVTGVTALALPIAVGVLNAPAVRAQSQAQARFDAASIKPNAGITRAMGFDTNPGRFVARNVTLRMLIQFAYQLQEFQISGGPAWVNSSRYDVEAKSGDRENGKALGPMVQRLLEDRFQLSVRHEVQDLPIYFLSAAKGGPKLKSESCIAQNSKSTLPAAQIRPDTCGFTLMDNNMIRAMQIDMARFIPMLTVWVKRAVVDKTGFMGTFDVDLKWMWWTPFFGQKSDPFLDGDAALKMEESQCPEPERITRPA